MTPARFIAQGSHRERSEPAASQEHFIALCRAPGEPTPAEHDTTGAAFTLDRSATVTGPPTNNSYVANGTKSASYSLA
jgi:hypothetical protein